MLSKYQFEVLRSLIASSDKTQREIASEAGVSLLAPLTKHANRSKALASLMGKGV